MCGWEARDPDFGPPGRASPPHMALASGSSPATPPRRPSTTDRLVVCETPATSEERWPDDGDSGCCGANRRGSARFGVPWRCGAAWSGLACCSTAVGEARDRRAVEAGALVRPRSGWVATPAADPSLVAAARCGVVLTCVTRATPPRLVGATRRRCSCRCSHPTRSRRCDARDGSLGPAARAAASGPSHRPG